MARLGGASCFPIPPLVLPSTAKPKDPNLPLASHVAINRRSTRRLSHPSCAPVRTSSVGHSPLTIQSHLLKWCRPVSSIHRYFPSLHAQSRQLAANHST